VAVIIFGCDSGADPEPVADASVPPTCQEVGCPDGRICMPDGRCASPDDIRGAAESCTALSACLGECPDQVCVDQCLFETSDLGYRRYIDLLDCLDDGACFAEDGSLDEECMFEMCTPQYEGCFGALPARPAGNARCGAFVSCLNSCPVDSPEEEQACLDGCVRDASPAAFERYVGAVQCIQSQCPDGDPACQQDACAEALAACFDHGLGTGALPCGDVLDCAFSCPDRACYDRCESDASAEALELWRAFVSCAAPAGCGSPADCLAPCPAETRACQSDE